MQRYEDVAIPMQANLKDVEIINQTTLYDFDALIKSRPCHIFSDEDIDYLNELSRVLIQDQRTRSYPDVATFSFFCRRANLIGLKNKFKIEGRIEVGRGILFHIAPSNVPVNFAYSLIVGLLSGNINIVKVPSKNFEQVEIIVNAINNLSIGRRYESVSNRIFLVKYDRDNNHATKYFSSICNVRIIWGGNESIRRIREHTLSPRAFDVTFPDRYSLCVINADSYIAEKNTSKVAEGFYNDTYLFDQNACTSPHLIVWLGSKQNVKKSQSVFWDSLHALVKDRYTLQSVQVVDKITEFFNQSLNIEGIKKSKTKDNLLWRIKLERLDGNIEDFRCSGGYFNEYHASSISEITSVINTKYQTMSYYGIPKKELIEFIYQEKPNGIDRITPIGKTMDFSFNWDGYDLIHTLSRVIEVS